MKSPMRWIDGRVNVIAIVFLFWAVFWGLNGGDKFFNGEYVANLDDWSVKGVLVDSEGYTRARLFMAQGAQISVSRDHDGVFHSEFEMVARLEFLSKGGEVTWSVPVGKPHGRLLGAASR